MMTKKRNIQKYFIYLTSPRILPPKEVGDELVVDKINFLWYNRFESLRKKHIDKIKILCYNNNEVKIWGCMVSTGVSNNTGSTQSFVVFSVKKNTTTNKRQRI